LWGHLATEALCLLLLIRKNIKVLVVRVWLRRELFPGKSIERLLLMALLQAIFHVNVLIALPLHGVLLPLLLLDQEAVSLPLLTVL
jgi:hypothetical protein